MSVLEFARSKVAVIVVGIAAIAAASLIAAVCGCPAQAVCVMAAVLTGGMLLGLCFEYGRNRRFYRELSELSGSLEHPYQLASLMRRPLQPDQQAVFEALEAMGKASADEVALSVARESEHREFVEGWVHGVKAPLASCELVAERVAEPERSQLRHELDRIGRKVDSALWYARSDSANRDYAIRETALAEIPAKVCRENARFLIEHDCIPEMAVDPGITVFTDAKQVGFIVTQLVENSAKYGAHHLRFSAETVGAPGGSQSVALHVDDDGRGIPERDIARVFERGFTGTHGHADASSTGMGLYLAAKLCDQLGLGLSLASTEGEGTRASLSFPLDRRRLDVECDKSVRMP